MKRGEEGKEKVLESFLHMGQEVPRDAWGRLDSRWGGPCYVLGWGKGARWWGRGSEGSSRGEQLVRGED